MDPLMDPLVDPLADPLVPARGLVVEPAPAASSASALDDGHDALAALLGRLVRAGGSDLHLRAGSPARLRVQGRLVDVGEALPGPRVAAMVAASMAAGHRARVAESYAAGLDADYALTVPGVGRFRGHAFRAQGEPAMVLRRVPEEPRTVASLGLPPVVRDLALRERGLVLVTGPTGSGKTTTLAAMVHEINLERPVHVLTLEDPVEVVHRSERATVTQRELGVDVGDWGSALRAAMRQDPDVILVGEMRDAETVRAALMAAETGHLVLSTMHTTDALETVQRVIDYFPGHEQPRLRAALAACLRGVVCQRLVPRRDGDGRVCALEVAVADARLTEAVADPDRTLEIPDIVAEGSYSGMQTFDQHLVRLVLADEVDAATARGAATNPHDFTVALRRAGWRPAGESSRTWTATGGVR